MLPSYTGKSKGDRIFKSLRYLDNPSCRSLSPSLSLSLLLAPCGNLSLSQCNVSYKWAESRTRNAKKKEKREIVLFLINMSGVSIGTYSMSLRHYLLHCLGYLGWVEGRQGQGQGRGCCPYQWQSWAACFHWIRQPPKSRWGKQRMPVDKWAKWA